MSNNDETRPYTIPYTGSIAIKQEDGSYIPSSSMGKASTTTVAGNHGAPVYHSSAQVKAPVVAQPAPAPGNPSSTWPSNPGARQAEEPLPRSEAHAMLHKFNKGKY